MPSYGCILSAIQAFSKVSNYNRLEPRILTRSLPSIQRAGLDNNVAFAFSETFSSGDDAKLMEGLEPVQIGGSFAFGFLSGRLFKAAAVLLMSVAATVIASVHLLSYQNYITVNYEKIREDTEVQ